MRLKVKYLMLLIHPLLLLLLLLKIKHLEHLVKTIDFNTKISEIENKITADHDHDKFITTQEFNRLTSGNFTSRLKQAKLESKNDIANFKKKTSFDKLN